MSNSPAEVPRERMRKMENFVYKAPTEVVFGPAAEDRAGEMVRKYGGTKVLILYGGGSVQRSGLLVRVEQRLTQEGIGFVEMGGVVPNPRLSFVNRAIALCRKEGIDFLLAVGGGSVIDCSKAIAFGYGHDGDVWDFFCGKARPEEALAIACVLTLPAAGSEASGSCVISNDELGQKRGTNGDCFRPTIAVMDPELTLTLPSYQTAAGITDMICHVCERFFSGTGSSAVTDGIATSLVSAIIDAAGRVMDNPNDYDARADIMWAGTLAHNDIAGCGLAASPAARAGGWESHGIEHELSALDPAITHGAGLAVIMPAWMRHVYTEDPQRFAQFGRAVFGIEPHDPRDESLEAAALTTIQSLQSFFTNLGMPSSLGELGIGEDSVEVLVENLAQTKGEVFGGFKKLGREDTRAIYESVL